MSRLPCSHMKCDIPQCTASAVLQYGEVPPEGWFTNKFGDYCPAHAKEESVREWRPFEGPIHKTKGWQSLHTSKIVYQEKCPTAGARDAQGKSAHEGESGTEVA